MSGGPIELGRIRDQHNRFLKGVHRILEDTANEAARFAEKYPSHQFKHPTGALEAATKAKVIRTSSGNRIVVTNTKKYARAQDKGSGIHATEGPRAKYPIVPVRAKALRWVSGGYVHFAKLVMHPGVKATRFLYLKTEAAAHHEAALLQVRLDAHVAHS